MAVRLVLAPGERISVARVAMGGVANIPLRMTAVEAALEGPTGPEAFERAGQVAGRGVARLPMTAYKVDMIPAAVVTTLGRALDREA